MLKTHCRIQRGGREAGPGLHRHKQLLPPTPPPVGKSLDPMEHFRFTISHGINNRNPGGLQKDTPCKMNLGENVDLNPSPLDKNVSSTDTLTVTICKQIESLSGPKLIWYQTLFVKKYFRKRYTETPKCLQYYPYYACTIFQCGKG